MSNGKNTLDDFLNPKSMLTPGVAGTLTMMITNVLSSQFGLQPNWTGLAISFLVGLVVFRSFTFAGMHWGSLFYILNSLVIFSVAVGTNQGGVTAAKATGLSSTQLATEKMVAQEPFFSNWLDGTVERRKELLTQIQSLDNEKAEKALHNLGIQWSDTESSPQALARFAVNLRTAGEIQTWQAVIKCC